MLLEKIKGKLFKKETINNNNLKNIMDEWINDFKSENGGYNQDFVAWAITDNGSIIEIYITNKSFVGKNGKLLQKYSNLIRKKYDVTQIRVFSFNNYRIING